MAIEFHDKLEGVECALRKRAAAEVGGDAAEEEGFAEVGVDI